MSEQTPDSKPENADVLLNTKRQGSDLVETFRRVREDRNGHRHEYEQKKLNGNLWVGNKEELWHLVRRGMLMQLHFDLETFGLDRDFAQISAYGDALGDAAGNFIGSEELQVKRPDRYLPDPRALAVTRTDIMELDQLNGLDDAARIPHPVAMGKIAQRFEEGAHQFGQLPLKEKSVKFETVRKIGEELHKKKFSETILEYPLEDSDGNIVNDVRYHPDRKMMAYRFDDDPGSSYYENIENAYYIDSDGSKWKFVEPRLGVNGFRIQSADMNWLRPNLVKAGFHPSNIFFTHSRATITNKQKPKNFAIDTYNVALATHAFGPQGEDGLKLGERVDNKLGEEVVSATLTRLMEANTRYASEQRGISEGVRMPDGSLYKHNKAHRSPAYDAQAAFSLFNYCRQLAPNVVRDLEMQADEQELRRVLPGLEQDTPPVFAMVRNNYPHFARWDNQPLADPVTSLGFDDQLGQMRKAIIIRLNEDFYSYKFNGKRLDEMTGEDFAFMIQKQRSQPDALINLQPIRRWPGAVKIEDAKRSGMVGADDADFALRVDDNYQYLVEHPSVCEAIRSGVEIINATTGHRPDPANPLMEEQAPHNGFGDLDYLEQDVAQEKRKSEGLRVRHHRGEVPAIVETLYNKAMDIYNFHKSVDELLHRLALQPHPIDWSDSEEALDNYRDLLKRVKGKLNTKDMPYKFIFDKKFNIKDLSLERARQFRWDLAKRMLNDDEKEKKQFPDSAYSKGLIDYKNTTNGRILFGNLSRNFRIIDQKDRELSLDYIKRMHGQNPRVVQQNINRGIWRIQFYRLSSEPSITSALFRHADMGRLNELSPYQQAQYEKLKRLYINGPSDADPSDHRWPSLPRIEHDLTALEINARQGAHEPLSKIFGGSARGEGEIYLTADESHRIVANMRKYLEPIKAANPATAAFRRAANFDPATGAAYEWITHEIDPKNVVYVDVPDPHLRKPLEDLRLAPAALVIPKIPAEDRAKIRQGATLILRGQQTGRLYYPGTVDIIKPPGYDQGYQDFYGQAEKAYVDDAGVAFPKPGDRQVLVIQQPVPLAQSRRNIDPSIQAIKVPSAYFDGLTAPRLAHFSGPAFTGLVMPVDYTTQKLEAGKPIRFREMKTPMGAKLTGSDAADTGHIYESEKLNSVRRLTVAELRGGAISNEYAQKCGFSSAYDLWEKVHTAFLEQEVPDPDQEEVYVLDFEKVSKKSWAYWNPTKTPDAAFTYDGEHVPPSAYRMAATNDNRGPQPSTGTGPAPG